MVDPIVPKEVDRILGTIDSATCLLDPSSSWLVRTSWKVKCGLAHEVVNGFLSEGTFLPISKKTVVPLLPKQPFLDPTLATSLITVVNYLWWSWNGIGTTRWFNCSHSSFFRNFIINHGNLLARLQDWRHNVTVVLLFSLWFSTFLCDWFQLVCVWSQRLLTYTMPQGSTVSAFLINIYMKLLGEVICWSSIINMLMISYYMRSNLVSWLGNRLETKRLWVPGMLRHGAN